MTGDGTDIQGRRRLPRYWTCQGGVEDSVGDNQPPHQKLNHLPQRATWVLGRFWDGDHLPQVQTDSAGKGHEVGRPVCDIYGPAQGVQRLGKVHMPVNPGGIRSGTAGTMPPIHILVPAHYGDPREQVLRHRI